MTATPNTEQLPSELVGFDADAPNPNPRPELQGAAPDQVVADTGWRKMACYNLSTGELAGYLASSGNNAYLTQDVNGAENLQWYSNGADLYLRKDTDPNDRYLGVGWNSYACWGLWTPTGWVNPVIYNTDHTISLKGDPNRKLYGPEGNGWVRWSAGNDQNQNILRCEWV
jgi:hypothetical protein